MTARARLREALKVMSGPPVQPSPRTAFVALPAPPDFPHASSSVFCIATTERQAEAIIQPLAMAGVPTHWISALFPETTRDWARALNGPRSAVLAVHDGPWSWLKGVARVSVSGLGPTIAAGPIVSLFEDAPFDPPGVADALMDIGVPEYDARRYEGRVREGNILLAVHSAAVRMRCRVRDILETAGAQNISYTE